MIVKQAIPCQAFDVNQPLSASEAALFKGAGFDACIRYIPRTIALIKGNLTIPERDIILNAGLSLMVVQHVSPDNWEPTAALGKSYGSYAATYAEMIGLPEGIAIWLDLEMVSRSSTSADIIAYCDAWFDQIMAAGFQPGIYAGYQTCLTDQQLYDLPFLHYWRGYNCNHDIKPRGWQILQHTQKSLNGIYYDPNTIQADLLGDLPIWVSPS
jgi:hypothetical protein